MNAAAKKELPPPATADLGAAMRRRYEQAQEQAEEQAAPESVTSRRDDVETSRRTEATTPRRTEATTSRRRDVTTPRRRAPAAEGSVAWTVRYDPDESLAIDTWLLGIRRELGRARLDKSEVIRALVKAARDRPEVREALLDELSTS